MFDTKVLMFGGKIHSGKNLAAEMAKEILESKGVKVSCKMLAKGVKDGCKKDFKVLVDYLNKLAEEEREEVGNDYLADLLTIKDENWYENKTELSRILLQIYGTEIFRDNVDKDWWSKKLADEIEKSEDEVVIITDFRFPSESSYMKSRFGFVKTVRITREDKSGFADVGETTQAHSSETALDDFAFDTYIENNGTVEELKAKIGELLDKVV